LNRRFLWTASHMWKWPVTLCPGGTNPWCTKPSMSKNSGNFLTAPSISYNLAY
jgi:hypothetical protein